MNPESVVALTNSVNRSLQQQTGMLPSDILAIRFFPGSIRAIVVFSGPGPRIAAAAAVNACFLCAKFGGGLFCADSPQSVGKCSFSDVPTTPAMATTSSAANSGSAGSGAQKTTDRTAIIGLGIALAVIILVALVALVACLVWRRGNSTPSSQDRSGCWARSETYDVSRRVHKASSAAPPSRPLSLNLEENAGRYVRSPDSIVLDIEIASPSPAKLPAFPRPDENNVEDLVWDTLAAGPLASAPSVTTKTPLRAPVSLNPTYSSAPSPQGTGIFFAASQPPAPSPIGSQFSPIRLSGHRSALLLI
jgi:hypothetical protein